MSNRDTIFSNLPAFDIEQALAGKPYIHRFDVGSGRVYHGCRRIEAPHSGYMIWSGEWLTYLDEDVDQMLTHFRMCDRETLAAALVRLRDEMREEVKK